MSVSGDFDDVSVLAGQDLSGAQYQVIGVAGTIVSSVGAALGIVLNKPKSGEAARVAYSGHMKGRVGAAVAAGDELVVTNSGFLITNATSVSGIVGKALKAANSGSLVEFVGDFSVARTSYSTGLV